MDLRWGVCEHLPWPDRSFDKACAVHTIYFWPQPARDLAEIYRVLRPGGRLVLGYRPGEDAGFVRDFPAEVYDIRPIAEIEAAVAEAGFATIETGSKTVGRGLMAWTVAHKGAR